MSATWQSLVAGLSAWGARQKQIPKREALWVATGAMLLALLIAPLLSGAMEDVATLVLLTPAAAVGYCWLKHKQKLRGWSGSLGIGWRTAIVGVSILIPVATAISLLFTILSQSSMLGGLPLIGLLVGFIPPLLVFGAVVIVVIIGVVLLRRSSGSKFASQVSPTMNTTGTQVSPIDEAGLKQLFGVLNDARRLGQLFVDSGLAQKIKAERSAAKPNRARRAQSSWKCWQD